MGYSYCSVAGASMDVIEAACKATRAGRPEETVSNTFYVKGQRYFFEVTRRDRKDGGVAGTISLAWDDARGSWARQVGTFVVNGKGDVVRGPALFKAAVARHRAGK